MKSIAPRIKRSLAALAIVGATVVVATGSPAVQASSCCTLSYPYISVFTYGSFAYITGSGFTPGGNVEVYLDYAGGTIDNKIATASLASPLRCTSLCTPGGIISTYLTDSLACGTSQTVYVGSRDWGTNVNSNTVTRIIYGPSC